MAAAERLICASADLPEGGKGWRFTVDRFGRETPAFAIRHRGRVFAYLNECGHVPAQLDWMPGEFFDISHNYLVCATHGAYYSPATGLCLGGPCKGRSLTALAVTEIDGQVYLNEQEIR